MIDCMIIGDSVAVGIGQVRQECMTMAHVGWNSRRWNQTYLEKAIKQPVTTVIISLGANDFGNISTESELRTLRSRLQGQKVFWIGAGHHRRPRAQAAIDQIAKEFGDIVLSRPQHQLSADGVHPTTQGYRTLANATQ